jgi:hypothetical protein
MQVISSHPENHLWQSAMKPQPDPHYRFPAEIISHAVWLYHVFSLSLPDVNCLLAERGVVGSYETVRSVMQDIRPELCPTNCVTASHGLEAALVGLGIRNRQADPRPCNAAITTIRPVAGRSAAIAIPASRRRLHGQVGARIE